MPCINQVFTTSDLLASTFSLLCTTRVRFSLGKSRFFGDSYKSMTMASGERDIPPETPKHGVKSSKVSPGLADPSAASELAEHPVRALKSAASRSSTKDNLEAGKSLFHQLRWRPTSHAELIQSEKNLLALLKTPYKTHRVNIGPVQHGFFNRKEERIIHTIEFSTPNGEIKPTLQSFGSSSETNANHVSSTSGSNDESEHSSSYPVLVMLHGYGAAHGFYFRNYDMLAKHFRIYSIDQLGWGASSRPTFSCKTTQETEAWFVDSLEDWRKAMNLDKFILLGHSFGGYVAARYSMKYPGHVQHLVLVGPAGFCAESERMAQFRSTWQGAIANYFWNSTTPQSLVRALGPWGKNLVNGYTSRRFGSLAQGSVLESHESVAFTEYMYHTIAGRSSGENCLKHIFSLGAFARNPLLNSVKDWKASTSFIYGVDDWMDYHAGLETCKRILSGNLFRVPRSGHYVFVDNAEGFYGALLQACKSFLPAHTFQNLSIPTESFFEVPVNGAGQTRYSGPESSLGNSEEKTNETPTDFYKGERFSQSWKIG